MSRKLSDEDYLAKLHFGVYSQNPETVKDALNGLSDGGKKDIRTVLNAARHGTRLLDWSSEQTGENSGVISKLLMNHGADPRLADSNGRNPIERAIANKNYGVIDAILGHPKCPLQLRGKHWKAYEKVKLLRKTKAVKTRPKR